MAQIRKGLDVIVRLAFPHLYSISGAHSFSHSKALSRLDSRGGRLMACILKDSYETMISDLSPRRDFLTCFGRLRTIG
jgi:hypothetical protein